MPHLVIQVIRHRGFERSQHSYNDSVCTFLNDTARDPKFRVIYTPLFCLVIKRRKEGNGKMVIIFNTVVTWTIVWEIEY
jgi:hypothetical protein